MSELDDAYKKLSDARCQLVMRFKFFGYLALNFKFTPSDSAGGMGTICVDPDKNIYFNVAFINSLSLVEATAILAHEVMHVVQGCLSRFPIAGNRMLWNLAADWVVNTMLLETDQSESRDKLGKAITEKAGFPLKVYEYAKNKTTEQIYLDLMKEDESIPNCGNVKGQGSARGKDKDDPGPECQENDKRNGLGCSSGSQFGEKLSKNQIQQREWTEKILGAAKAANMDDLSKGNVPGWLTDFFTQLNKPTVTWKDYVRRAAMSSFRGRYSWSRPGRRSDAIAMRLQTRRPSPRGAVIMIDSSGSISDKMLTQFLSETAGIMRACGANDIWVYFHDVECYYRGKFTRESLKKIKVQRGGTSHVPVFKAVMEDKHKIGLIISFTDLMSDFPGPTERPKCPMLWAIPKQYENHRHPWGDKVVVDISDEN